MHDAINAEFQPLSTNEKDLGKQPHAIDKNQIAEAEPHSYIRPVTSLASVAILRQARIDQDETDKQNEVEAKTEEDLNVRFGRGYD